MPEITINNPTRKRKWGWGFSTTPTGQDAYSIQTPTQDITGTLNQISEYRLNNPIFNNLGGAFYNEKFFYDEQIITGIKIGNETVPFDFGYWEPDKYPVTLIVT